jgi:hypothetical protein
VPENVLNLLFDLGILYYLKISMLVTMFADCRIAGLNFHTEYVITHMGSKFRFLGDSSCCEYLFVVSIS